MAFMLRTSFPGREGRVRDLAGSLCCVLGQNTSTLGSKNGCPLIITVGNANEILGP